MTSIQMSQRPPAICLSGRAGDAIFSREREASSPSANLLTYHATARERAGRDVAEVISETETTFGQFVRTGTRKAKARGVLFAKYREYRSEQAAFLG
jgi:hypothetical protein